MLLLLRAGVDGVWCCCVQAGGGVCCCCCVQAGFSALPRQLRARWLHAGRRRSCLPAPSCHVSPSTPLPYPLSHPVLPALPCMFPRTCRSTPRRRCCAQVRACVGRAGAGRRRLSLNGSFPCPDLKCAAHRQPRPRRCTSSSFDARLAWVYLSAQLHLLHVCITICSSHFDSVHARSHPCPPPPSTAVRVHSKSIIRLCAHHVRRSTRRAGITTYSPLRYYGLDKPGQKIGVVG